MSLNQPLSTSELAERDRWEERNADQPKALSEHSFDEFIALGLGDFDAFIDFLEIEAAKIHKDDGFFKPRHYAVQAAMDDLKKHYANGGRKP